MLTFKSFLTEQPTHPESKPTHKRGHDISKHAHSLKPVGSIKTEDKLDEDGMGAGAVSGSKGPTNVTGPQSGTDPVSATAVNMKKKKKYLMGIRRNPPKM